MGGGGAAGSVPRGYIENGVFGGYWSFREAGKVSKTGMYGWN